MDTENGCGITEMQRKVASAMMTCGEDETLGDVLGRSGVTAEEYAAWLEDGRFTGYLAEAAYRAVEAAAPRVATALARVAQSNVQAMKLYFDILWKMKRDGGGRDGGLDLIRDEIFGGPDPDGGEE